MCPVTEQYRIVAKVEQLMKLCYELEQSIQHNQKYTQELLHVALERHLLNQVIINVFITMVDFCR